MHIRFIQMRYKNILSTGNTWTVIDFEANPTTLIIGSNGAGKSTILDALVFCLYGRPFRKINKPQLVNSINRSGLLVEVDFETGGHKYSIRRGIKPNIFEAWCDDNLINQDAFARDYQSYLEEDILKLNLKSFTQIVVLGSSTFVPFMQLQANGRREILENLLDIQVFTTMHALLKDKISQCKDDLQAAKYRIDLIKNRIVDGQKHNKQLIDIHRAAVDDLVKEEEDTLDKIAQISRDIDEHDKAVKVAASQINDAETANQKHRSLKNLKTNAVNTIKQYNQQVSWFDEHSNCPTCQQDIPPDHKAGMVTQYKKKIAEICDHMPALEDKIVTQENRLAEIAEIDQQINNLRTAMSQLRTELQVHDQALQRLQRKKAEATQPAEEIETISIAELQSELIDLEKAYEKLVERREVLAVCNGMLREGGIRTQIIKQYIPIINKLINKYLADLEFFVQFELDEQFNESIKSRHRDTFAYQSFSEGEKMRIDLALLLTWRAVSKLRNSVSTNLLIMDEVFDSSLDSGATEEFLSLLNEMSSHTNVFIISHKGDALLDKFDHVMRFEKVKNFSRLIDN